MEYSDKLIEITKDHILFRHYYFPAGSKRINVKDIQGIEVHKPTLLSGKYRIHGTGDFRTWFPCDPKRPARDKIFIITLKKRWWRIGFTAEQSNLVELMFEQFGLITG